MQKKNLRMKNKQEKKALTKEVYGLPKNYPSLSSNEDFLFYIQRNLDRNTVVFTLNYNSYGEINLNEPMCIHWKMYEEEGQTKQLNALQSKVAYGYNAKLINSDAFSFQFLAYERLNFFLAKEDNTFKIICTIKGKQAILNKIFVQLDVNGIFPQGIYYELYGEEKLSGNFIYEKTYF